jgi:hypothetical protein
MALGETPITFSTTNLQLTVTSASVDSISDFILTMPASASQLAHAPIQPKITFGSSGLSACAFSGSYAQLSLVQWKVNPYAGSNLVLNSLLRYSSTSQASSGAAPSKVTIEAQSGLAYAVTLQFSKVQDFNFTAAASFKERRGSTSNFTIPACTLYNGAQYVPCVGCNISSYTNYNVTYSCYDITQLCPSTSARRDLGDTAVDDEGESEGALFSDENVVSSERSPSSSSSRSLQTADDDGGATAPIASATFGVLLQSIGAELSSVLSENPFSKPLGQSTIVLAFLGCFVGFIIISLLLLRRLDHRESLERIYLKNEGDVAARKLLEGDIKNGGNGNHDDINSKPMNASQKDACLSQFDVGNLTRKKSRRSFFSRSDSIRSKEIASRAKFRKPSAFPNVNAYDMCGRSSDEYSSQWTSEDSIDSDDRQHAMTAAVTGFLHKLFPGRSIFKKNMNALNIIFANHAYLNMLAGSSLRLSRTIRFLDLISLVLVCIFVDSVFFGVFYPVNSPCVLISSKVVHSHHALYVSNFLLFSMCGHSKSL